MKKLNHDYFLTQNNVIQMTQTAIVLFVYSRSVLWRATPLSHRCAICTFATLSITTIRARIVTPLSQASHIDIDILDFSFLRKTSFQNIKFSLNFKFFFIFSSNTIWQMYKPNSISECRSVSQNLFQSLHTTRCQLFKELQSSQLDKQLCFRASENSLCLRYCSRGNSSTPRDSEILRAESSTSRMRWEKTEAGNQLLSLTSRLLNCAK